MILIFLLLAGCTVSEDLANIRSHKASCHELQAELKDIGPLKKSTSNIDTMIKNCKESGFWEETK